MSDSTNDTMNNLQVTGFVPVTTPDLSAIDGGCIWCYMRDWFGCGGKTAPTQPPKPPTKESQLPVFQWQG